MIFEMGEKQNIEETIIHKIKLSQKTAMFRKRQQVDTPTRQIGAGSVYKLLKDFSDLSCIFFRAIFGACKQAFVEMVNRAFGIVYFLV